MPILIVIAIILLVFIIEFNSIRTLQKKVLQSRSSIDVYLNQRFELIPNLVECVKGYTKHEQGIIEKIMEERNAYKNDNSFELANKINTHFNNLLALQESYPDLKASEQFLNLQQALEKIESQLQAARRLYNGDVTIYNTKITTFPGNFVGALMRVKEEMLFEVEEYKKENIDIGNL